MRSLSAAAALLACVMARADPPPEDPPRPVPAVASGTPDAPAGAPRPDLRPAFVGHVSDLALLDSDPVVRPRADALRTRRTAGALALAGSAAGVCAAAVMAIAASATELGTRNIASPTCSAVGTQCVAKADYTGAWVALGVSGALAAVGVLLLPRRHDVAEVARLWNARHPDAPVETWAPPEDSRAATETPEPPPGEGDAARSARP